MKQSIEEQVKTHRNELGTALSLISMAELCKSQGKTAESISAQTQAEGILRNCLGRKDLDGIAGLAESQLQFKNFVAAETLFKQILEFTERSSGSDSIAVALLLHKLALCAEKQNRYADAETLYKRCLEIYETNLDQQHATIAKVLEKIANLLAKSGRTEEADALQHRVDAIWNAQKRELWFAVD